MSESTASLRHKIKSAGDLQSVVRTMKVLAAASVGQYDKSVEALADYRSAIELGLGECIRQSRTTVWKPEIEFQQPIKQQIVDAIVFGTDQGLVGQFNDVLANHVINTLADVKGTLRVWVVGERMYSRLGNTELPLSKLFAVPNSIEGIAPLIEQLQIESQTYPQKGEYGHLYVFHNYSLSKTRYEPIDQRLLPLDSAWQNNLTQLRWPTNNPPEILSGITTTLHELIREYLFISLFQSCAESLACENSSRLSAMNRADRNIDELLQKANSTLNRLRQSAIDEELFDVVAGYKSLISTSANAQNSQHEETSLT